VTLPLADNKLAEKAGWDRPTAAAEVNYLAPLLAEIGLEIADIGFEPVDIDLLLGDLVDSEADPGDLPPPHMRPDDGPFWPSSHYYRAKLDNLVLDALVKHHKGIHPQYGEDCCSHW